MTMNDTAVELIEHLDKTYGSEMQFVVILKKGDDCAVCVSPIPTIEAVALLNEAAKALI